ncbi:hypothetical protein OBBRIDRAFT_278351 [Obba rivulosa]|uniref:Uncharacterized protein n=1 Tax=Obba rivulosa TaxID=1052685 RepID=A0A8E2DQ58_9APHY|nr:hypothetical protein OBBRIDRAFT_278351 [Obba rivulosa]
MSSLKYRSRRSTSDTRIERRYGWWGSVLLSGPYPLPRCLPSSNRNQQLRLLCPYRGVCGGIRIWICSPSCCRWRNPLSVHVPCGREALLQNPRASRYRSRTDPTRVDPNSHVGDAHRQWFSEAEQSAPPRTSPRPEIGTGNWKRYHSLLPVCYS